MRQREEIVQLDEAPMEAEWNLHFAENNKNESSCASIEGFF